MGPEKEEETSLCYLPTDSSKVDLNEMDEYAVQFIDYFEFFTTKELQSEMCPAEDIIVSGKVRPLKDICCRLSESSSELKTKPPSRSVKTWVARNYYDTSSASFVPDLDRNYSRKSDGSSFGSPKMRKFHWQSLIFGIGMVKFPLEMELRDIKYRQSRRRCPAALFPATPDSESKSLASGRHRGRGPSWGLIKALSCKDHRSTSVNTSFVYMPHV